ncbi:MAG: AAA family ATPase [Bacteroidales bacterium]|nr:AAA family ATPase [Bacteroidales bacterium]
MEKLFGKKDQLLRLTSMNIVREAMNTINWDAQLICLRGARGVGKTTLMLQYIKSHYRPMSNEVLYVSLDAVYFSTHTLIDLADRFYKNGGKHLFVDEVHKYNSWSREIKEIYDTYPDMRVVISGSSLLNILGGDADLSRRCIPYELHGLSFREYLQFFHNIQIQPRSLQDILEHPEEICSEVLDKCHPLPLFKDYLQHGYFPFYLKSKENYATLIEQVVNYVIETELPQCYGVDMAMVRKIKALMSIVSSSIPYEVDATKLSGVIGVHRTTVVNYLYMLDKAKLINMLFAEAKTIKKLQKPDKIYIENPNMLYALAEGNVEIGTARETFCINQLRVHHNVEYSKKQGDFRVDGKYTFEIGEQSKGFGQVAGVPDSYVLADDIETPFGHKLPLWTIGFLY